MTCKYLPQVEYLLSRELPIEEQNAIRSHIASCVDCQHELDCVINRFSFEAELKIQRSFSYKLRSWRRKIALPPILQRSTAITIMILIIIGMVRFFDNQNPKDISSEILAFRGLADRLPVRLSYQGLEQRYVLDGWRGQNVLATPQIEESLGGRIPDTLRLRLTERGRLHGAAIAELLSGMSCSAAKTLRSLADPTPSVMSDMVAAQLSCLDERERNGKAVRPLELIPLLRNLNDVIARNPRAAAALWNRARIYQLLGLEYLAATDYGSVAEIGETDWTIEAEQRREYLLSKIRASSDRWKRLDARLEAVATVGATLDAALLTDAKSHPGMARGWLYHAVCAANTAARVRELRPLAEALDQSEGDSLHGSLVAYLEEIAKADFSIRGPLARDYTELLAGRAKWDEPRSKEYLRQLLHAGQRDQLQGAVWLTRQVAMYPEVFEPLKTHPDPWFRLLAAERLATAADFAGDVNRGEQIAQEALSICRSESKGPIKRRCALLHMKLTELYLDQQRVFEADLYAQAGLKLALSLSDFQLTRQLLSLLGKTSFYRFDEVATRAYFREALGRAPESCPNQVSARLDWSMLRLWAQDSKQAVAEFNAIPTHCEAIRTSLLDVRLQADLIRLGLLPDRDVAKQRAEGELKQLRQRLSANPLTRGELILADHFEGRLRLEFDRTVGLQLLQNAIGSADDFFRQHPGSRDVNAIKARAYSYSLMILDAAKRGDWPHAYALFGQEANADPDAPCQLGATVEDGQLIVAGRSRSGEAVGAMRSVGIQELSGDVPLITDTLTRDFRGCAQIRVLARNWLAGRTLLPPNVAWSIHRARSGPVVSPAIPDRRLVVSNPRTPAELMLDSLEHYVTPTEDAGVVLLSGEEATPARVLVELQSATEVEFHAHGLMSAELSDAAVVVLSPENPDTGDDYALTAEKIRGSRLAGHPVVFLAACHLATAAPYQHTSWSLPMAFLTAGARAVVATPELVSNSDAEAFFSELRQRSKSGQPLAQAVRDVRISRLGSKAGAWAKDVLFFD